MNNDNVTSKNEENNMLKRLHLFAVSPRMLFAFSCSYLVLAFLTFTFIFARSPYLTYVSYLLCFWGGLIVIFSLFSIKYYKFNKIFIVLLLFIVSFFISSLFMSKYGISDNIKGIVWLSLEIIVLFGLNRNSIQSKYMYMFIKFFVVVSFIYAVISLLMALFGYVHLPTEDNGDIVRGGMLYGRLFGMYADPNYGAVTSCLAIFSCFYLCMKKFKEGSISLIVYILIIIVELFYIALSGSRTGIVSLIVACIVSGSLIIYRRIYKNNVSSKFIIKSIKSVILSSCFALLLLSVTIGFEFMYETFEPKFASAVGGTICNPSDLFLGNFANSVKDECGIAVDTSDFEKSTTHVGLLGRNESQDVSNQRLSLWISSLEIFKTTPVIGASNRNFLEYAKENLPDTYVVAINYESMHNVFFDVLVSQGLIGLILWIIFLILLIKNIISAYKHTCGIDNIFVSIISGMFVCLLVASLFYSEFIYVNTIGSVFFWYVFSAFSDKDNLKIEVNQC